MLRLRPPRNPRINWGHPLADRLLLFMSPPGNAGKRPYDLVTGEHANNVYTVAAIRPSEYGEVYSWPGTSSDGSPSFTARDGPKIVTMAAITRLVDTVNGNGSEFFLMCDSGSDRRAALYLQTFSNRHTNFIWDPSGTYYIAADTGALDTEWHHWLGTKRIGNSDRPALYKDGMLVADASDTSSAALPSPCTFYVARSMNECEVAYAAIWERRVNADEALWMSTEPYAFLEENTARRYFFLGSTVSTDMPIWDFPALTDPIASDILAIIDDPSGTPTSKKITLSDLLKLFVSDVTLTVLTGSGTYSIPTGLKKALIFVVGGGGGGNGGAATDSAGGGGGGGGTVVKLVTVASLTNRAYVVGGGGAASSGGTANAGTTSTFNVDGSVILTAGGGGAATQGAAFSVVGVSVAGGTGGTATQGDLNIPGMPGEMGVIYSGTNGWGGSGGNSAFGLGAGSPGVNTAGGTGGAYGGGGAGGHASGTLNREGGAGAAGTIFLLEFYG